MFAIEAPSGYKQTFRQTLISAPGEPGLAFASPLVKRVTSSMQLSRTAALQGTGPKPEERRAAAVLLHPIQRCKRSTPA
jgi:hypothetical protein